jgi:hypothetical protein
MDFKEPLRDALQKCDQFKLLATRANAADRETFSQLHSHYEKIARLLVQLKSRRGEAN